MVFEMFNDYEKKAWFDQCNRWKNKWSYQLKKMEIDKKDNSPFSIYEIMELVSRSLQKIL